MHLKVLWRCCSFPLAFRRTEEKLLPSTSLLQPAAPWEYVIENTTSVGTVRCASVSSQWDCGWSIYLSCRGLKGSGVPSDKKPVGTCSLCGSYGSGWAAKFTAHVLSGWKGNADVHALLGEAGWSNGKKAPGCYSIQFFRTLLLTGCKTLLWVSEPQFPIIKWGWSYSLWRIQWGEDEAPKVPWTMSTTRTHCMRGGCVGVSFKLIQVSCLYNTLCFKVCFRQ